MKLIIFFLFLLVSSIAQANENYKKKIKEYIENISSFHGKFYQVENAQINKGEIFFSNDRLRVEYLTPTNLIFVLKNNKVMYYNIDLEEVQYFSPKNTSADLFISLFNDSDFFNEAEIKVSTGYVVVDKNVIIKDELHILKIYFENKPILLRKIELNGKISKILFSITDLNFNPTIDKSMFSLANPLLK